MRPKEPQGRALQSTEGQIEDKEIQISIPLFEGQKEQIQCLEEAGFHKALAQPCSSLHNPANQPKQIWFQLAKLTLLP
ncbi:hypothetical protein DUI87_31558 [Hirundo rustica rustica]|uniref:Uncharacterized protein n=1 Tax=Hirundo rustica rustica TaxID=333673 RepID=A0A3M0IZU6_HIRRU|nr:hypothetical protein DUI87_31558 [Hirundo rustica rustica]